MVNQMKRAGYLFSILFLSALILVWAIRRDIDAFTRLLKVIAVYFSGHLHSISFSDNFPRLTSSLAEKIFSCLSAIVPYFAMFFAGMLMTIAVFKVACFYKNTRIQKISVITLIITMALSGSASFIIGSFIISIIILLTGEEYYSTLQINNKILIYFASLVFLVLTINNFNNLLYYNLMLLVGFILNYPLTKIFEGEESTTHRKRELHQILDIAGAYISYPTGLFILAGLIPVVINILIGSHKPLGYLVDYFKAVVYFVASELMIFTYAIVSNFKCALRD